MYMEGRLCQTAADADAMLSRRVIPAGCCNCSTALVLELFMGDFVAHGPEELFRPGRSRCAGERPLHLATRISIQQHVQIRHYTSAPAHLSPAKVASCKRKLGFRRRL